MKLTNNNVDGKRGNFRFSAMQKFKNHEALSREH